MCAPASAVVRNPDFRPNRTAPLPPDLTDALLDATTRTEAAWLRTRKGRRGTFLTGQEADSTYGAGSTLLGSMDGMGGDK